MRVNFLVWCLVCGRCSENSSHEVHERSRAGMVTALLYTRKLTPVKML